VPFFIDRLHEHFEKRGDWIENGWRRDPQEYLQAGNIWTTCEPEEPILPGVIDVLGDDFIMFASDYPHWDGEWPESTKHLRTRPDISEETRAKIGGLSAKSMTPRVLHTGRAPAAVPAHRDERHHDVIAWYESGYAVADLNDGARAFVVADHGKHRCQAVLPSDLVGDGHVALEDVVVRVAQARRGHLDENLADT